MNEAVKYLDSGLLEDFCLGLLPESEAIEIVKASEKFPEVRVRIEAIEEGLKAALQVQPSQHLKSKIFQQLNSVHSTGTINLASPPLINKYSDAGEWKKAVSALSPVHDFGGLKVHPILQTPNTELYVAWVHDSVEEDGHSKEQFAESFLILEGSCECSLGGKMHYLEAGDYLEIPFCIKHTITSTSKSLGYVKAILQRRKFA